jgi:site-specific recombinase XerD
MEGVKLPKVAGDVLPALAVEEIERLLIASTSTRDRAMLLALLDTGCRAAEFVALDVGDVAPDGTVLVRQGKGKKARRVRLGERSLAAVRAHLAERGDALSNDAPLWLSENSGQRLGVQGLRQALYRLGRIVGIERPHPHAFRRSCALFMWRAGATEWAIASYLGHSDLTTIRRYLAMDDTDMIRVHEHYGAVRSLEEARPGPRERPKLRIVGGRR